MKREDFRIIFHSAGVRTTFPVTPETMINHMILPIARSQVDCLSWLAHTYLMGPFDMPRLWTDYLDPSPYEYLDKNGQPIGLFAEKTRPDDNHYTDEDQLERYGPYHELWKHGIDVVDLVCEEAHRGDMAFFIGFRMNDAHHGHPGREQHPRWWLEHQDMTISGYSGPFWALQDYSFPEVREHRMAPMVAACECYDINGLELEFGRWPMCFRKGQEKPDIITEFIAELKRRIAPIGKKKNREFKIMARAHPDYKESLAIGLDYKRVF